MKKNLFNLSAVTILVMAVLIIFAMCKRECENCEPPVPDAREKITFTLNDKSHQAEFSIIKYVEKENNRETAFRGKPDEQLFQFFKEYCLNKNITVNDKTLAFVLYYNLPVSQSLGIVDEHLKGISVYNVEGRKVMHHLFLQNEKSEFYEIENVNVHVPWITAHHNVFYLENYVFTDPQNKQNKSDLLISGDFEKKEVENRKKYRTAMRYEKIISNNSKGEVGEYCANIAACGRGFKSQSCDVAGGQYTCYTNMCATANTYETLNLYRAVESMFINMDLMYDFRDNVLYNSEIGETYVDNYYYLSEEFEGKITLSLAIQSALFFRDFNSVMEAFVNPAGHESEIMFNAVLTNILLDLLDQYDAITTSKEGKDIISSIKADINNFKGKTLQELLALL